ncbi:MAG: catalase [Bacteriovoracaceae bacterium]
MVLHLIFAFVLVPGVSFAGSWAISNPKGATPPYEMTSQEESRLKALGLSAAELFDKLQATRPDHLKRLQHHKIHGCLKGKLAVSSRLKENFETPVFKKGAIHDVWARFSNINKDDDSERDLHGMAVRVLDPSRKNGELTGQDFLGNDTPKHFVRTPEELMDFLHFMSGNRLPTPDRLSLFANAALQSHTRHSLLEDSYHSRTHFRFGTHNIRYGFFPCSVRDYSAVPLFKNHLSKNLREEARKGVCFDFKIQVHDDRIDPPINDYTQVWNSPYQSVARLTFPPQDVRANSSTCENLSFDSWRTLPEHRPLGFLNKARWYIYKTSRVKGSNEDVRAQRK